MSRKKKDDKKQPQKMFEFEKDWPPKRQKTKSEARQKQPKMRAIRSAKIKSREQRQIEHMELARQQVIAKEERRKEHKHTPGPHNRNSTAGSPDGHDHERGKQILKTDQLAQKADTKSKKKLHGKAIKGNHTEKGVM